MPLFLCHINIIDTALSAHNVDINEVWQTVLPYHDQTPQRASQEAYVLNYSVMSSNSRCLLLSAAAGWEQKDHVSASSSGTVVYFSGTYVKTVPRHRQLVGYTQKNYIILSIYSDFHLSKRQVLSLINSGDCIRQ